MPKAKPVSLFPLSFDEAMDAFMRVDPANLKLLKPKRRKRKKAKAKKK